MSNETTSKKLVGILCSNCWDDTKVTDSRPTQSGTIRRRRECIRCGKRFTTWEIQGLSLDERGISREEDEILYVLSKARIEALKKVVSNVIEFFSSLEEGKLND